MKHQKRILTLLLACLMTLGAFPLAALTSVAADTTAAAAEREWTDEDYEALYVHDADGDGADDRIFFWDAFDLTAEDGEIKALVNQLNEAQTVTVTNGTAGDGYLATGQMLDFSPYFKSFAKTVSYKESEGAESVDVLVLQDATWEMVMFQNTLATSYPSMSAYFGHCSLNLQTLTPTEPNGSFIKQTYGTVSGIGTNENSGGKVVPYLMQLATDTGTRSDSWASRNFTVFNNPRGPEHTFTFAMRQDFTVAENEISGTMTMDFLRDGTVPNNGKSTFYPDATTFPTYYDARYRGNWKNAVENGETPTIANNQYSFGGSGQDWAYRAIRIYDVALTEAQIAQNHAADLFKYYKLDPTTLQNAGQLTLSRVYNELCAVNIGDANAKETVVSIIEEVLATRSYAEYYVSDGLTFVWSGENHTHTYEIATMYNWLNPGQVIAQTTSGRMKSEYFTPVNTSFRTLDKGLQLSTGGRLILNDILPTRTLSDGTKALADMTLEVLQAYPYNYYTSATATKKNTRAYNGTHIYLGPTSATYTKNVEGSFLSGGTSYANSYTPYTLKATGETVYIPTYSSNTNSKNVTYYTYDPQTDTMTKAGTLEGTDAYANVTPTLYNGEFSNGFASYSPFDANGYGPIGYWTSLFTAYDSYGKPNFMNASPDTAFTTVMSFDYGADEDLTATSYSYALGIGRDGAILSPSVATGTYQAVGKDYTTQDGKDDGYDYALTYGLSIKATNFYALRVYNRILTAEEQAQNHFIDIAMQLGADLSIYDQIASFPTSSMVENGYAQVHALTVGKDAGDFTATELEAAIEKIYETVEPAYSELYVQDGLTFLWMGDGYKKSAGATAATVSSLPNLLDGGATAIDKTTYGRQYFNLTGVSGANKLSYTVVDGGVILLDPKPILTDLVPTATVEGCDYPVLTDMTLEVSQSYFDSIATSSSTTATAIRQYNGGSFWAGPLGYIGYRKGYYNSLSVNGTFYCFMNYMGTDGKLHPFYVSGHSADFTTCDAYTYDEAANTMVLITDESILSIIRATQASDSSKMANLYYAEGKQCTAKTPGGDNAYTAYPATNGYGIASIYEWSTDPFKSFDKFGAAQFINNHVNQAFTTTMVYDYAAVAAATSFDFTLGRDGQALQKTNHAYDATADKTVGYSFDGNKVFTSSSNTDNLNATNTVTTDGSHFAFTYGLSTNNTVLHAIRIYNRALSADEMAQNNFIDIAVQLGLNLRDYALSTDKAMKAAVHALTAGHDAGDFEAEALQTQIDLMLLGGSEYGELVNTEVVRFDGYSVRLHSYPGLRAVFKVDRNLIKAAEKNTLTKIKEIGAIVGIKGEHNDSVEDLTVAGGKQMQRHAVYADGAWAKNEQNEEKLFYRLNANGELETYFALTTTFAKENEQTEQYYETELLFRGYMTLDVNGKEVTVYTDMEAPSFDTVSMCAVSEVFALRGWEYKDVATIKNVLETCGLSMPYADKTYAADSFLKANGSIDKNATGDLNVVYIGGSLTEGASTPSNQQRWVERITAYLQDEVFPNKKVNGTYAGIGGTNSEAAAARFCEHVAPFEPDIIFVDYTVNDDMNNFSEIRGQYRLENFLYQCSQLEKVPTVIYLHTPPATLPDSAIYQKWAKQRDYKDEWAEHYGIEVINIYDYSYGKWETELAKGETDADYITWLDDYYGNLQDEVLGNNNKYGRYDVHGGYQLYYEAIVDAFEKRAEALLEPYRFMPYMHSGLTAEIERTYVVKTHNDEMFTYSENGWDEYYEYDETIHKSGYLRIPSGRWVFPFFNNGIHQGNGDEGAYFTFETDANSMTMHYMSALNDTNKTISADALNYGGVFEIWHGETKLGSIGTASTYVQPFISSTVDLKNPDNETIQITVKVTKADGAHAAYGRFGSIWFGYNQ